MKTYKVEDKYGKRYGIFIRLEDARKLAISLGNEKLYQLIKYSDETSTVLHAEMSISIYPYNGDCCFHVVIGDYGNDSNFIEENYFDVIVVEEEG